MLLPIRTDYRLTRKPVINYAIIVINVAVFLLQYADGRNYEATIRPFLLDPVAPHLGQFFTSVFLHASWGHILGNMIFLWVFGNAVNDRFGHVAYTAFYLGGGVLSGVGYVLLSGDAPVLGASGAIAGVTGCYLVLFPRVRVTVIAWLFWMLIPMEISSLYFLGFQFAFNIWASLATPGGGVAYVAHAVGYVYGIALAAALLAMRVLPRDVYDMLSLWKAYRRRASYRRMISRGYDPFGHHQGPAQARPGRPVRRKAPQAGPAEPADTPVMELRRQIAEAHGMGNFPLAAAKYLELVAMADDAVLSRQQQLDVSNHLMSDQRHGEAADAYERFIRCYPNYEHMADIRLMLGIIYGRYLQENDRAEENLRLAIDGLQDKNKLAMARAEMEALRRP